MKQMIINSMKAMLVVPLFALSVVAVVPTGAASAKETKATSSTACTDNKVNISSGANCAKPTNTPTKITGNGGIFKTIVDVMLFIIGAVAVIMLIIGGIRYTVSGGDSNAITSAKNTILYAIIGIIVAILAYAIVSFVITSII